MSGRAPGVSFRGSVILSQWSAQVSGNDYMPLSFDPITIQGDTINSVQGSSMFGSKYIYETNNLKRCFFYPVFMFGSLNIVPWIQRMLAMDLLLVNNYYLQLLFAPELKGIIVIQNKLANASDREMLFLSGCFTRSHQLSIKLTIVSGMRRFEHSKDRCRYFSGDFHPVYCGCSRSAIKSSFNLRDLFINYLAYVRQRMNANIQQTYDILNLVSVCYYMCTEWIVNFSKSISLQVAIHWICLVLDCSLGTVCPNFNGHSAAPCTFCFRRKCSYFRMPICKCFSSHAYSSMIADYVDVLCSLQDTPQNFHAMIGNPYGCLQLIILQERLMTLNADKEIEESICSSLENVDAGQLLYGNEFPEGFFSIVLNVCPSLMHARFIDLFSFEVNSQTVSGVIHPHNLPIVIFEYRNNQ